MMAHISGPRARRDAPALRFLLFCLGGWIALRVMASWNPGVPPPPPGLSPPAAMPHAKLPSIGTASLLTRRLPERGEAFPSAPIAPTRSAARTAAGKGGGAMRAADYPNLRLALMARLMRPLGEGRVAGATGEAAWVPAPPGDRPPPGSGQPFWMQRRLSGWAFGGWVYVRQGGSDAAGDIAASGTLGGSQAGARLAYGFGDSGRVRAFVRANVALARPQQREMAFGLAFAPLAKIPVDVAIERRVAIGPEGRDAFAAMLLGGVSGVPLPADFRLDAYAQAGVVGARRRDGFAEAAIVVDHAVGPDESAPLRVGALAAGSVQPDAARVDVGPRVTLRLPDIGEGGRIALDWRQRVAGDARPDSGLALTLAADF